MYHTDYVCYCFQSTSTYNAFELSYFMRYINSWLTYLLTTCQRHRWNGSCRTVFELRFAIAC